LRSEQVTPWKETAVMYVGVDLHRSFSRVAALDEQGTELLSRGVTNDPDALRVMFRGAGS
jgi:hypothetical protein